MFEDLKRRNDENEKPIIPVKPRTIAVQPQAKSAAGEPELSLADYDQILEVIQSMVKVFERSPLVFKSMKEEDLRTILLVALNGVFKGNATGDYPPATRNRQEILAAAAQLVQLPPDIDQSYWRRIPGLPGLRAVTGPRSQNSNLL